MKFKDFLPRADLESLQFFLKNGVECYEETADKKYDEMLFEAREKAMKFFEERFTDIDEYDEILGYFDSQTEVYEKVYFEIGLLLGAKLGYQIRGRMEELL